MQRIPTHWVPTIKPTGYNIAKGGKTEPVWVVGNEITTTRTFLLNTLRNRSCTYTNARVILHPGGQCSQWLNATWPIKTRS